MIKIKNEVDLNDLKIVNPKLMEIFCGFLRYALLHDMPVVITSIYSDRLDGKSSSHFDKRAIDISSRGWEEDHIRQVQVYIGLHYRDIGAISKKDFKPRPIVYHDAGSGYHFHIQCKP